MVKTVECPNCNTVYDIDQCKDVFECCGCESYIEVKYDIYGKPYLENY